MSMRMKTKYFLLGCSALCSFSEGFSQTDTAASVQPPAKSISFSGSVDGYYRYNFSDPHGGTNNYTSFTNSQNSFELGMASLRVDQSSGRECATVDLGFGRRAEEFAYADKQYSTLSSVMQAYVSYAVTDKIKITAGKWATHIGYELLDAYLNRNYSMDYMFSYGPFSHTGVKADVTLSSTTTFMVGIANPTDHVTDTTGAKYAIAQFATGTKDGKFKAYLNYQGANLGSNGGSVNQFDLVATETLSGKFNVGYNGTIYLNKPQGSSTQNWWGSAVYLNLDPTTKFGITLRGEYFDNQKGVSSAPATNLWDFTLSPNIRFGNLTIIPELRYETAKDAVYINSSGNPIKSTVTGLLAMTYHF